MRAKIHGLSAIVVSVFIGLLFCAGSASATMVTIWPDQFKIDNWDPSVSPTYQNPDQLWGTAHYYAVLNIPVGSTVKFIRANYNNPPAADYGFCVFLRRKTPSTLMETLIDFSPAASAPLPEGTHSVWSQALDVHGPLTIMNGYRYYIQLEPGLGGSINSIQIMY